MTLVNKEPVHTEFFKGNNIVLAALVVELFQLLLHGLFRLFKLFNGEVFSTISLQIHNTVCQFFKLLLKNCPLSFNGHRYFFKLRMTDNHCVIIARSNSPAELFTVLSLKISLCRYENIRCRIELQELRRPLFG